MTALWRASLLGAALLLGIASAATVDSKVYADATVSSIPGLDDDRLAILFAAAQPAFHLRGVWTLRITLQRHRSSQRVRDFLTLLEGIQADRCQSASPLFDEGFCGNVLEAYNVSSDAYAQLFPDDRFDGETPANTSVFVPEHVTFHEVSVNELWSQLHDGAGQRVLVDRFALLKLGELIRAKAARLKQLVADDADMWTDLLVHSTASTRSKSVISCPMIEDAFAHAVSVLTPGLTFKDPLSCTALPPLAVRRSEREISLSFFLDVGVVCGDILALPLPVILNDTHFLTLDIRDGAVLSCATHNHDSPDLQCAARLYRDGVDSHGSCPIRAVRAERAHIIHGNGQIFVVSRKSVAVIFKFKVNDTLVTQRAKLQGRKCIAYDGDTIVLLKGLSSDHYKIVKLVVYSSNDSADFEVDSAEVPVAPYVFLLIVLLCIFVPCFIFIYLLYFVKKLMWAASNI